MPFDLQAIAAKVSVWSGDGVKIAAAASRVYAAYQRMEPTTKAAIQADLQTLEAEWTALDDSLDAYDKANTVSKIAAVVAVGNVIAKAAPIIGRIAKDAETVFGADWSVIKPDVDLILNTLKGNAA